MSVSKSGSIQGAAGKSQIGSWRFVSVVSGSDVSVLSGNGGRITLSRGGGGSLTTTSVEDEHMVSISVLLPLTAASISTGSGGAGDSGMGTLRSRATTGGCADTILVLAGDSDSGHQRRVRLLA